MKEQFVDSMLESVDRCPICDESNAEAELEAADLLLKCSKRSWTYKRCLNCDSLFLAYRPKSQHLGLAYQFYYTHSQNASKTRKILTSLIKSYLNSSRKKNLPYSLYKVAFPLKWFLDAKTRGIANRQPGIIFDYGCGNGDFLSLCKEHDWICVGSDLDNSAVQEVRRIGIEAYQGGTEIFENFPENTFDMITISHVLEHMYKINDLLQQCQRTLKPGGTLWVETPNSNANGLFSYGPYWRGLEPPRHLFIFSRKAIKRKISSIGFTDIEFKKHFFSAVYMYASSEKIKRKNSPTNFHKAFSLLRGLIKDAHAGFITNNSEFLTLTCKKKY